MPNKFNGKVHCRIQNALDAERKKTHEWIQTCPRVANPARTSRNGNVNNRSKIDGMLENFYRGRIPG